MRYNTQQQQCEQVLSMRRQQTSAPRAANEAKQRTIERSLLQRDQNQPTATGVKAMVPC